ncbi:VOC family protein [Aquibacillus rhizosphaerae]|uniref:VOC family protein n=1 Tax=Aquibacillus rhizosphaerae TaxID=3051431 RepID=A0ABT7L1K0_9BACI|nr:VOC family protein [Aquibacillus sp. LR5S19]MDL4839254.1 VOC family protein [Aquibacillus sp. LR5S19]
MNMFSNKIGGVFIPVSNVEVARDWYCDILDLPTDGEIYFGHIYVLPLDGPNIVLDSKIYAPENIYNVPAFQLQTEDINKSYEYLIGKNVHITTEIENGHWFNFKDLDGNLIMVCK